MIRSLLIGCFALLMGASAGAREVVYVGVYPFAPFAYKANKHVDIQAFSPSARQINKYTAKGVIHDFIKLLNQHQTRFQFKVFPTTPTARFKAFDHGKFDMMLFESRQWGWEDMPVDASKVYLEGGEVYIAHQQGGRGQEFFDDLHTKTIIGIEGYHYGFAGMNSDTDFLKQNFQIRFTDSNESSIKMLLGGRGDIAVVTQSYLKMFLSDNPEQAKKLLISNKKDQHYHHTILIRQGHTLSAATINQWLSQMQEAGTLDRLWNKWGLDVNF